MSQTWIKLVSAAVTSSASVSDFHLFFPDAEDKFEDFV